MDQVPSAPGRLPLLGHGLPMLRRPLEFLGSLPARGPVVRIRLGALEVHVINDARLARSVLVGEGGTYDQGLLVERARPLLGDGVGMLNGEPHRRHRRIMQPAFHRTRIAGYAATMSRLGAARAASWKPGQRLAFDAEMNELALTTVATTLFSADFGEAVAEVQRSLPIVLDQLPRRAMTPGPLLKLPTRANRAFDRAVTGLHRVTREAVAASKADGADRGDLVSTLLLTRDAETGEGLTDRQVHDQLVNMMVAGTETTGAAMAWVFHELAHNPEAEAKLHEEVDAVLAGRPAGFDDLVRLDRTRNIVAETLRRYAPYLILRHAPSQVELGEFVLPAGASILISPYVLHRDPELFPEPLRFQPDRWATGTIPRQTSIPFGAGARQCPGNHFALIEMVIHVATLAARWRLRPMPGAQIRAVARGAAVHPSRLPMTAEPRF